MKQGMPYNSPVPPGHDPNRPRVDPLESVRKDTLSNYDPELYEASTPMRRKKLSSSGPQNKQKDPESIRKLKDLLTRTTRAQLERGEEVDPKLIALLEPKLPRSKARAPLQEIYKSEPISFLPQDYLLPLRRFAFSLVLPLVQNFSKESER